MSNFVEYTDEEYEHLKDCDKWGKCKACNHALICHDQLDDVECGVKECTCISGELNYKANQKRRNLEAQIKYLEDAIRKNKEELKKYKAP